MSEIIIDGLTKIYNEGQENEVRALDHVSFSIPEGEFVVVLGASGAGKSTLLNLLGGMDNATSGSYLVENRNVAAFSSNELSKFRRYEIGFVFQFYNLMPNLSALENVELASSVAHDPFNSEDILKLVGLDGRKNNFPSQLSGGEQQRVAIARAVVKNPRLLLCDEPTGALDSKTGAEVLSVLKDVSLKYKKTVIIVTHNSKIASVADRIIRIRDGHILENEINEKPLDIKEIVW